MSRVNVLRSVGLALTVVVFVAGALLIGQEAADPVANAEETVRTYYANTDASGVADRIVPGSLGQEIEREQLEAGVERLLQEPFEVEESTRHEVRGTRIVRVAVARPQGGQPLEWCVLPDGSLLLGCRVATVDLVGEVDSDAPVGLDFSAMDIQASYVQMATVLTTPGEEEVPLGDDVRLQGDSFELANAAYLLGGQQVPADPADLQVRPGAGLLLLWRAEDVEDFSPYTEGPFTLRWSDGSVRLTVDDVTWFIGEDAGADDAADATSAPTGSPAPTDGTS